MSAKAVLEDLQGSILLIDENGENLGKVTSEEALVKANEAGLDLVKVGKGDDCCIYKIMDYNKSIYKQQHKLHKNKKVKLKEVRFSQNIADHDLVAKAKHISKFLKSRNKVRITLMLKKRQHALETPEERLEKILSHVTEPFNRESKMNRKETFCGIDITPSSKH
jgi:translation initiation factor IF-3